MVNQKAQEESGAGTSRCGLRSNVAAALSYVLTIPTGIVFLIMDRNNKFIRFHAVQAILLGGVWVVIWAALATVSVAILPLLPAFLWYINSLLHIILVCGICSLWLFLIYGAYRGKRFKLPVIGDIAEERAGSPETI